MMNAQLQIKFPLFPDGLFNKVGQEHAKLEETSKEKEIEHLKHVIAGYKGWKTKRGKGCLRQAQAPVPRTGK